MKFSQREREMWAKQNERGRVWEEEGFEREVGMKSEGGEYAADDWDERRKRQLANCEARRGNEWQRSPGVCEEKETPLVVSVCQESRRRESEMCIQYHDSLWAKTHTSKRCYTHMATGKDIRKSFGPTHTLWTHTQTRLSLSLFFSVSLILSLAGKLKRAALSYIFIYSQLLFIFSLSTPTLFISLQLGLQKCTFLSFSLKFQSTLLKRLFYAPLGVSNPHTEQKKTKNQ